MSYFRGLQFTIDFIFFFLHLNDYLVSIFLLQPLDLMKSRLCHPSQRYLRPLLTNCVTGWALQVFICKKEKLHLEIEAMPERTWKPK